VPLDRILSDGVRDRPDVGVLGTRTDQGRVDILLWHYHDDDVPGPPADIHISLTGLAPGVQLQERIWIVDRENGDAFTAWKTMGSPANPSKSQVEQLISASQMAVQRARARVLSPDGSVTLQQRLSRQGVELIELEWKQ